MGKALHICHLTVLNPALHSRIFYKEAVSQVEAGHRVRVVGQDSGKARAEMGVEIQPISPFSRSLFSRLRARRAIFSAAVTQPADIFWLHTPELLGMVPSIKALFPKARFVYDMHEDYEVNLREPGVYPWGIRAGLARRARAAERRFAASGGALVFAEKAYESIVLPGDGPRLTLPNACRLPPGFQPSPPAFPFPSLALTGTLGALWGLWKALDLWEKLNRFGPVGLTIVGHSHDAKVVEKIRERITQSAHPDRIRLVGGTEYVAYPEVLALASGCTASLALYPNDARFSQKMPTKVFEAMAMGLRWISTPGTAWSQFGTDWKGGWDFSLEEERVENLYACLFEAFQAGPKKFPEEIWSWGPHAGAMESWIQRLGGAQ